MDESETQPTTTAVELLPSLSHSRMDSGNLSSGSNLSNTPITRRDTGMDRFVFCFVLHRRLIYIISNL